MALYEYWNLVIFLTVKDLSFWQYKKATPLKPKYCTSLNSGHNTIFSRLYLTTTTSNIQYN